jgi:hypothetical protein
MDHFSVSIALGAGRVWDEFTIFLLQSDGQVYGLCPVLPYACSIDTTRVSYYLKVEKQHAANREPSTIDHDAQYHARLAWIEETVTIFFSLSRSYITCIR